MPLSQAQKEAQRAKHPECYVCKALGVAHADLAGYENRTIQFDHWLPAGRVGSDQAKLVENQLPIHADPDGPSPLDPGWDTATRRNCHKGKSNKYTGSEWCDYIRIFRKAMSTEYSDDLLGERDKADPAYDVEIAWTDTEAEMLGQKYPIMLQNIGQSPEQWRSFATVVKPSLLWWDREVQSRSVDKHRVADMAWHLRTNPLLSPILCRWAGKRLKVFDGNHRLCSFILARGDHAVPVVIFEGPDPNRFMDVAAEAHDNFTQLKYQYTEKALKFSALNEQELTDAATKYGEKASEVLAWAGLRPAAVKPRIVGRIAQQLDNAGGWRNKWRALGLTDPSWNQLLEAYAKLEPESAPFGSEDYLRDAEIKNLMDLCTIFDEELFDQLDATPEARASLKTKWWKRAHARLSTRLAQVIRDSRHGDTPRHPAYTAEWDDYIRSRLREGVVNWRKAPVWRESTAANNEAEIDEQLRTAGFTDSYLID